MLLKAHKMTQKQLADRIAVSLNTLQGWIHYDRIPETATAYAIAVTLGVTLNYLLGGLERDITTARLKELAARDAASRITELAAAILEEAQEMNPIGKKKSVR